MLWSTLTSYFWHKTVAAAAVLAEEMDWCLKEVMVVAMAMAIVCDAARTMEIVMATSQS